MLIGTDPTTDLVNGQTLSYSEAITLESCALPARTQLRLGGHGNHCRTIPLWSSWTQSTFYSSWFRLSIILQWSPAFGEPQSRHTADAFRRWDRSRRQRMKDGAVPNLAEIAWCLASKWYSRLQTYFADVSQVNYLTRTSSIIGNKYSTKYTHESDFQDRTPHWKL
jgi:hypothetical protein